MATPPFQRPALPASADVAVNAPSPQNSLCRRGAAPAIDEFAAQHSLSHRGGRTQDLQSRANRPVQIDVYARETRARSTTGFLRQPRYAPPLSAFREMLAAQLVMCAIDLSAAACQRSRVPRPCQCRFRSGAARNAASVFTNPRGALRPGGRKPHSQRAGLSNWPRRVMRPTAVEPHGARRGWPAKIADARHVPIRPPSVAAEAASIFMRDTAVLSRSGWRRGGGRGGGVEVRRGKFRGNGGMTAKWSPSRAACNVDIVRPAIAMLRGAQVQIARPMS